MWPGLGAGCPALAVATAKAKTWECHTHSCPTGATPSLHVDQGNDNGFPGAMLLHAHVMHAAAP
jgi:hypothetical protein